MNEDEFNCEVQQTFGRKSRIIIVFNNKRIGTLYLDDMKTAELMKNKLEFFNEVPEVVTKEKDIIHLTKKPKEKKNKKE